MIGGRSKIRGRRADVLRGDSPVGRGPFGWSSEMLAAVTLVFLPASGLRLFIPLGALMIAYGRRPR